MYDLEPERYSGMPSLKPLQPAYFYSLHRQHQGAYSPDVEGPRTGASGILLMSDHSGAHIDALCHQAQDLTLHGGIRVDPRVETPWGFTRHGAEEIPPIVRRGIMIDVAGSKGVQRLSERYLITANDIEEARKWCNVQIKPDDVVLVRTGYGSLWNDSEKFNNYAGVSREATVTLADKKIFAVGIDNASWDLPGDRDPATKATFFAHIELIINHGIHIIENLYLEKLSSERKFEFLFVGLPLKLKGATASPLRPIALG